MLCPAATLIPSFLPALGRLAQWDGSRAQLPRAATSWAHSSPASLPTTFALAKSLMPQEDPTSSTFELYDLGQGN